jgi:hypothetical protein
MGIREQVSQIFRTRNQRDQDQRTADREQNRARTPEEATSQREARRLAGMSAEDRAWEQASLERHRAAQDRAKP